MLDLVSDVNALGEIDELRRRKLTKLFNILDDDGDNAVSKADYEAFAERVATLSGKNEDRFAEIRSTFDKVWDEFQSGADSDGDGKVNADQFIESLISPLGVNPARFTRFVGLVINLVFGLMDADNDGKVSKREHVRIGLEVLGISEDEANRSFNKLDTWGSGDLTMDAYVMAFTEFLTSTLPDADGNYLFGDF